MVNVSNLSMNERKVLSILIDKDNLSIEELSKLSNLSIDQVRSATERLRAKGLIEKQQKARRIVRIKKKEYLERDLPETLLFNTLIERKEIPFNELSEVIEKSEIGGAIGSLKSKAAILIKDNKVVLMNDKAKLFEQELLEKVRKNSLNVESLKDLDLLALKNLLKRGILIVEEERNDFFSIPLSKKKELKEIDLSKEFIEKLTPEILKNGEWRNKEFRPYEINSPVKKLRVYKRHLLSIAINKIRRIWLSMGFKEMNGPIINPAFWNFDVLFVPQDHPAREMQDTFYLSETAKDIDPKLFKSVSSMHEKGLNNNSWGKPLNKEISKKLLLRTHTTVLSALTLSKLSLKDLPQKFFAIGRVYRNETLDWKHLFDLHQIEGIVVDENLTLKHLIGYLKTFYKKMGYEDVRVKPTYFPFTEPSLEVHVYSKDKKQWLELGGAGILRPEVVKPLLGKEIPVLAWGLGLERIVMLRQGFKDIRKIYEQDIDELMYSKW